MKCTFDVQYYCNHCRQNHSTHLQYSRELENPPGDWDAYDDGRNDPKVTGLVGKTFACKEFPRQITKIQSVEELKVWKISEESGGQ